MACLRGQRHCRSAHPVSPFLPFPFFFPGDSFSRPRSTHSSPVRLWTCLLNWTRVSRLSRSWSVQIRRLWLTSCAGLQRLGFPFALWRNLPKRCQFKVKNVLFFFPPPLDHQQSSSAVCRDHIKGLPFVSKQRERGKSEHPTCKSVSKCSGRRWCYHHDVSRNNCWGKKNSMSLLHHTKSISISCIAFIHLSLSRWRPFTGFSGPLLFNAMDN